MNYLDYITVAALIGIGVGLVLTYLEVRKINPNKKRYFDDRDPE